MKQPDKSKKVFLFKNHSFFFIPFIFLFFSLNAYCISKKQYSFNYEYNVPQEINFDFTRDYLAGVGYITVSNTGFRKKKFRHIHNNPNGYLFNRKTQEITHLTLITHTKEPRELDSLLWAVLDSATYYIPVKARSSVRFTAYLNLNHNPKPREMIEYIAKNHKDLEYHIFNPENFPSEEQKAQVKPDRIIRYIKVKPCKHGTFCK